MHNPPAGRIPQGGNLSQGVVVKIHPEGQIPQGGDLSPKVLCVVKIHLEGQIPQGGVLAHKGGLNPHP